jgi:signal transduction histidine kinase
MIRRLVVTYLLITAFGLALLAIPLGITFAHREKDRLLFDVERDADTMAAFVGPTVDKGKPFTDPSVTQYGRDTGGHVVIVDTRGVALLDTEYPKAGRDYASRPEIATALRGMHADGTRRSDTLGTTLLFASVPVTKNGNVIGAVRITYPTSTLNTRVRRIWASLVLLCFGVLVAVAIVGFVFARSITRPVRRLEEASDKFAAGDLSARVDAEVDSAPPELRRLATTFNRMASRLAGLLEAQQQFVADASHQLRTPLTALRLRLENIEHHVDATDRPAIDAAAAEITRMSRLVDGLLLLARDDGDANVSTPVDVARVAHERAEIWQEVVAERGATIAVDAPDAAWALAVTDGVEQLVDNLVDNALAVTPSGAPIVIRVETSPSEVALHVIDRGPGLDAEARARAFDRFWRAPDAAPGGSGLGLAIVRQLADASGGSARLDPALPHGIDAVVVLPATPAPLAGAPDRVATA